MNQGREENRSLDETLGRAWRVLGVLPRRELTMLPARFLDEHYPSRAPAGSPVPEVAAADARAGDG